MLYKVLPRESTVLMFDRADTLNFRSSLQVMRVGDRAMLHTLVGAGFYKLLQEYGLKPFREMGLRYLYAAVSDPHLVLLHSHLDGLGLSISLEGRCEIDGHDFNWILLSEGKSEDVHGSE